MSPGFYAHVHDDLRAGGDLGPGSRELRREGDREWIVFTLRIRRDNVRASRHPGHRQRSFDGHLDERGDVGRNRKRYGYVVFTGELGPGEAFGESGALVAQAEHQLDDIAELGRRQPGQVRNAHGWRWSASFALR